MGVLGPGGAPEPSGVRKGGQVGGVAGECRQDVVERSRPSALLRTKTRIRVVRFGQIVRCSFFFLNLLLWDKSKIAQNIDPTALQLLQRHGPNHRPGLHP